MELIPNKLYFAVESERKMAPHRFPTRSINLDEHYRWVKQKRFTPPSIRSILAHCAEVTRRLREFQSVLYLTNSESEAYSTQERTNSALFMGAYAVLHLGWSTKYTMQKLMDYIGGPFCYFCDHNGSEKYRLGIYDCMEAITVGVKTYGWFTKGDTGPMRKGISMNWVIPSRILAMKDPKIECEDGTVIINPKYKAAIQARSIGHVIRLNDKDYEHDQKYGPTYSMDDFFACGIAITDIFFKDGGIPKWSQVDLFLRLCAIPDMRIAVHCHAGLGRTGTMIACILIRDHGFTSRQAVAWLNLCRRGSIMGKQHQFLDHFYENLDKFNSSSVYQLYYKEAVLEYKKTQRQLKLKSNESRKKAEREDSEPAIKKGKRNSPRLKKKNRRTQSVLIV